MRCGVTFVDDFFHVPAGRYDGQALGLGFIQSMFDDFARQALTTQAGWRKGGSEINRVGIAHVVAQHYLIVRMTLLANADEVTLISVVVNNLMLWCWVHDPIMQLLG
jgi:hypothetical protein